MGEVYGGGVSPRTGWGRIEVLAASMLGLLVLASLIWATRVTFNTFIGDPGIYLVYAKNVAAGHPFQFNVGEFSSGATSPLWQFLLAPAFFASTDSAPMIAKALTLALTVASLGVFLVATQRVVKSILAAAAMTSVLAFYVALSGLIMFEVPLAVMALSAMLYFQDRCSAMPSASVKELVPLAVCWSLLPLARPELVVVGGMSALVLAWRMRARPRSVFAVLATFAISTIPCAVYFGYSWLVSGHPSVSAASRQFSVRDRAGYTASSVPWVPSALRPFRELPVSLLLPFFSWGLVQGFRERRWWSVLSAASVAVYVALYTVVVPLSNGLYFERYFIGALVLASLVSAWGLRDLMDRVPASWAQIPLAVGAVAVFGLLPANMLVDWSKNLSGRPLTVETIYERESADLIGEIASPGDLVLTYEVQLRYFLREDVGVLSLDGVIDGKVLDYAAESDLEGFLLEYRPRFWVVNGAVGYRPYLMRSLFAEAAPVLLEGQGATWSKGRISMTTVAIPSEEPPPGFVGALAIAEITYRDE